MNSYINLLMIPIYLSIMIISITMYYHGYPMTQINWVFLISCSACYTYLAGDIFAYELKLGIEMDSTYLVQLLMHFIIMHLLNVMNCLALVLIPAIDLIVALGFMCFFFFTLAVAMIIHWFMMRISTSLSILNAKIEI